MKKYILLAAIIFTSFYSKAQNAPVVEKSAPKSNNGLSSGGTLGSNSGVNPNGNPGTILSYSGNSNSINSRLEASPNIEPGVFLSSSPEGTVRVTTVTNGTDVRQSTSVVTNGSSVTTSTENGQNVPVTAQSNTPAVIGQTNSNAPVIYNTIKTATKPAKAVKEEQPVVTIPKEEPAKPIAAAPKDMGKKLPAFSPVLSNYVPEQVITKIKNKYGPSVYDIKTVKIVSTNKIAYMVRLVENGKFKDELYYDEP